MSDNLSEDTALESHTHINTDCSKLLDGTLLFIIRKTNMAKNMLLHQVLHVTHSQSELLKGPYEFCQERMKINHYDTLI